MRPPRFRVRTLMLAVAVVAVTIGAERSRRRWSLYRGRAAYHAARERAYRGHMAALETMDRDPANTR